MSAPNHEAHKAQDATMGITSITLALIATHPPALALKAGPWIDPLSRDPFIAALLLTTAGVASTVTIDLRQPNAVHELVAMLEQAGIVYCHDLAQVIVMLRVAGICLRKVVWFDTRVAERALRLGQLGDDEGADTIVGCLAAHRITGIPFVCNPDQGQDQLLAGATASVVSPTVIRQATAVAQAIAAIASAQQQVASPMLILHLAQVEMPAALEHALMAVYGVQLSADRCQRLCIAMPAMVTSLLARLAETGLTEPNSEVALRTWLRKLKVLDAFETVRGHLSVDDDALKEVQDRCPPLRLLRQLRRIQDLAEKPWLAGMMTSADGRVHPNHAPLQAPTTRSSTSRPELTNLPRRLRPIVVAAPGMGLIELDYKGVEVLVAAIRFDDKQLLSAYMTGDVISALAKVIFVELAELSLANIADHHDHLRARAKTIVYGVLYGRKAHSLSRKLGISEAAAQRLIDRLMDHCPKVSVGMRSLVRYARRYGRIPIAFGLARFLTPDERAESWKVETLAKNTPIQGTAAIVFRYAMILVARAIQPLGGRILLPIHDAFVIEGPLEHLAAIVAVAKQAMMDAFAIISATARPFVEVEDKNPRCWCKKGKEESFERYVADPIDDG